MPFEQLKLNSQRLSDTLVSSDSISPSVRNGSSPSCQEALSLGRQHFAFINIHDGAIESIKLGESQQIAFEAVYNLRLSEPELTSLLRAHGINKRSLGVISSVMHRGIPLILPECQDEGGVSYQIHHNIIEGADRKTAERLTKLYQLGISPWQILAESRLPDNTLGLDPTQSLVQMAQLVSDKDFNEYLERINKTIILGETDTLAHSRSIFHPRSLSILLEKAKLSPDILKKLRRWILKDRNIVIEWNETRELAYKNSVLASKGPHKESFDENYARKIFLSYGLDYTNDEMSELVSAIKQILENQNQMNGERLEGNILHLITNTDTDNVSVRKSLGSLFTRVMFTKSALIQAAIKYARTSDTSKNDVGLAVNGSKFAQIYTQFIAGIIDKIPKDKDGRLIGTYVSRMRELQHSINRKLTIIIKDINRERGNVIPSLNSILNISHHYMTCQEYRQSKIISVDPQVDRDNGVDLIVMTEQNGRMVKKYICLKGSTDVDGVQIIPLSNGGMARVPQIFRHDAIKTLQYVHDLDQEDIEAVFVSAPNKLTAVSHNKKG